MQADLHRLLLRRTLSGLTLGLFVGLAALGCSGKASVGPEPGSAASTANAVVHPATLETLAGLEYLSAVNGGGAALAATSLTASVNETFTLYDLDGGDLMDGDSLLLVAHDGEYVSAPGGGGAAVMADGAQALDWEIFIIHKLVGSGAIGDGDEVALQTKTKDLYVSAVNGGGGAVRADRSVAGSWEAFTLGLGAATTPPAGGNDGGTTGNDDGGTTDGGTTGGDDGGTVVNAQKVVAYLPTYSGSYSDWAQSIDFTKMTHLNLAFVSGTSSNDWSMDDGQSDAAVKALVDAAHAKGVKVLASLGGGGGDQTVIAQYKNTGNIPTFVANLDTFVAAHNFDGVDIDIEDGANLGANYSAFVDAVVKKLRPEGKLVTAAVAQYLQDSMSDTTLHQFDFLNVMIYSNYNDSVSAMTYYAQQKSVPATQVVLGAGFFGSNADDSQEWDYSDILKADSSAWSKDSTTIDGQTVNYTGMASMKKLADYSKGYGGIMFWELSADTTDSHSLYKVIQGEF